MKQRFLRVSWAALLLATMGVLATLLYVGHARGRISALWYRLTASPESLY